MTNDDDPKGPAIGVDFFQNPETGEVTHEAHGPDCARTKEIYQAFKEGREPTDPRSPRAARCSGPAQVATEAYRSGWEGVFGNKTVGQA